MRKLKKLIKEGGEQRKKCIFVSEIHTIRKTLLAKTQSIAAKIKEKANGKSSHLFKGVDDVKLTSERLSKGLNNEKLTSERPSKGLNNIKLTSERLSKGLNNIKLTSDGLSKGLNNIFFNF